MTCANARSLVEFGKTSSDSVASTSRHRRVVAPASKQHPRRQQRRFRGTSPAEHHFPANSVEETAYSGGCTPQFTATAPKGIPSGPPRAEGPPSGPPKPNTSVYNTCHADVASTTTSSLGKEGVPVLPPIPSTGALPSSGGLSNSSTGPRKRRDYRLRRDDCNNREGHSYDHPLRKHRRGNHDIRCDGVIDSNNGFTGSEGGTVRIWCCPTTGSLREEACADLSAMSRPGLWRKHVGPSQELQEEYAKLERLKTRFKSEQKRRGAGVKGSFLSLLKEEIGDCERERWMKRRALLRADRFTLEQKRELREWFDCLDRDGSGEIDSSELSHPLLCTGLARSAQEVGRLVRQVDKDGSGEIGFKEFLSILQPRKVTAGKSMIDKIVHLQEVKNAHGTDMETVVATERRSLLMKEILDEAAFRLSATDDVEEKRYAAQSSGDNRVLRTLQERESLLERRRERKNLFIQAVSDATDFQRERQRLDEAALKKVQRRELRMKTRVGLPLRSQSCSKLASSVGGACPSLPPSMIESLEPGPWTVDDDSGASCGGAAVDGEVDSTDGIIDDDVAPRNEDNVSANDSNVATAFAHGNESRSLAAQEEYLLQRRRHHKNFKKSASTKNLSGTNKIVESSSCPFLLGQPDERVNGGGTVAGGSFSVTTRVEVYHGGNTRPSSLPEEGGVIAPPPDLLRALGPHVEARAGDAGVSSGRGRRNKARGSPGFDPSSRKATRGRRRVGRAKTRTNTIIDSLSNDGGGDVERQTEKNLGDSGGRNFPSTADEAHSTISGSVAPPAVVAAAGVVETLHEREKSSAAIVEASPSRTPGPPDVGTGVSGGGKGCTTESWEKKAAGDWYRRSNLRVLR